MTDSKSDVMHTAMQLAEAYRAKMIKLTEREGRPNSARQWQRPWDQTDATYREAWCDIVRDLNLAKDPKPKPVKPKPQSPKLTEEKKKELADELSNDK